MIKYYVIYITYYIELFIYFNRNYLLNYIS